MIEKLCKGCQTPINPKRLEILPKTIFCVKCSDTGKVVGNQINFNEKEDVVCALEIMSPEKYIELYGKKPRNISDWDE